MLEVRVVYTVTGDYLDLKKGRVHGNRRERFLRITLKALDIQKHFKHKQSCKAYFFLEIIEIQLLQNWLILSHQ